MLPKSEHLDLLIQKNDAIITKITTEAETYIHLDFFTFNSVWKKGRFKHKNLGVLLPTVNFLDPFTRQKDKWALKAGSIKLTNSMKSVTRKITQTLMSKMTLLIHYTPFCK